VYGFVYEIGPQDEESLDGCEGVPLVYEKKVIPIKLKLTTSSGDDETATKRIIEAIVYVDFVRTTRDVPRTEYVHRINMGLKDALPRGIPQSYVDKYIRPFIPPE
jgi:gamma-glutamylcyclotransferase